MLNSYLLEEQYGYVPYSGSEERDAWLLNYCAVMDVHGLMDVKLYFVDENGHGATVTVPYSPSFLCRVSDYNAAEDHIWERYAKEVRSVNKVQKIDSCNGDRMSEQSEIFLKVKFKTKFGFDKVLGDVKQILLKEMARKDGCYWDTGEDDKERILGIYEHDIPEEIKIGMDLNVKCGKWYHFFKDDNGYVFGESSRPSFPRLRTLVLGINACTKHKEYEHGECEGSITAISVRTMNGGELILNKKLVFEDFKDIEYTLGCDIRCAFNVSNENDEETVLIRLVEVIQKYRPHFILTCDEDFDFSFLRKKFISYNIDIGSTIGFVFDGDNYVSSFIIYLESLTWIRRWLRLSVSEGKDINSISKRVLGCSPRKVLLRNVQNHTSNDTTRKILCLVSNSVVVYSLGVAYVIQSVFSICSMAFLTPTTMFCCPWILCEALLISSSMEHNVLVPGVPERCIEEEDVEHVFEGLADDVPGFFERKTGIFRTGFEYNFSVDSEFIEESIKNIGNMLSEYEVGENSTAAKEDVLKNLQKISGSVTEKGCVLRINIGMIYFDVVSKNRLLSVSASRRDVCMVYLTVMRRLFEKTLEFGMCKKFPCTNKNEAVAGAENLTRMCSLTSMVHKHLLDFLCRYVKWRDARWSDIETVAMFNGIKQDILDGVYFVAEKVGIPLFMESDGIWCVVPGSLVSSYASSSGKNFPLVSMLLTDFLCKKFINSRFEQVLDRKDTEISAFFHVSGPYEAVVLPASEEGEVEKMEFLVVNGNGVAELFQEASLELIRKIREDFSMHFLDGSSLEECYSSLSEICIYWLDIAKNRGSSFDDDTVLLLLSEEKSCAGLCKFRKDGKPCSLKTFFRNILQKHMYVTTVGLPNRAVLAALLRPEEKDVVSGQMKEEDIQENIKSVIDWGYYKNRLEEFVQRMVAIPAVLQGLKNPLESIITVSDTALKRIRKTNTTLPKIVESRNKSDFFGEKKTRDTGFFEVQKESKRISLLLKTDILGYIDQRRNFWIERMNCMNVPGDIVKLFCDKDGRLHTYRIGNTQPVDVVLTERRVYMDIGNWTHFCECDNISKVTMYLPDSEESTCVAVMQLEEQDFVKNMSLYRKFFDHFSIRSVFEDKIPILYNCMQEDIAASFDYVVMTSFMFKGNDVYSVSMDKIYFLSGEKGWHELGMYILRNIDSNRIFLISKEDQNRMHFRRLLRKFHILEIPCSTCALVGEYKELCDGQRILHQRIREEAKLMCETSKYTKIPLLNIGGDFIDMLLYMEMKENNVLCDFTDERENHTLHGASEDFYPGFYGTYSIEFECVGSLILSVVEYKAVLGGDTLFEGVKMRDFIVLRKFLRRVLLDSIRGVVGTKLILRDIVPWIKRKSKVLSDGLQKTCCLLQQGYIACLARKLRENDYGIISVGRDTILINTGKVSEEEADAFFKQVSKKMASLAGYEMMKVRMIRVFRKLAFIDPRTYFFPDADKYFCFSETSVPVVFLKNYFEDDTISCDLVYRAVQRVSTHTAKMILKMISFKTNTQLMISNSHKLLGLSEFGQSEESFKMFNIICPHCETEGMLGYKCARCYRSYPKSVVLDFAISHLKHLLLLELAGDSYCSRCNRVNERRLFNSCECGGVFERQLHRKDFDGLRNLVNNEAFDEICNMVSDCFRR